MATVKIETTMKVEATVEAGDLFKDDVMSPMEVDIPALKPTEDDEDDDDEVKDESDFEEEEGTAAASSEPPESRSETPASTTKKTKPSVQLIGHLPRAEAEAMKTFIELPDNFYQYQTLGRSREALESMTCDCTYQPGSDDPDMACGRMADCINRLTQVECVEGDCRCRKHCRNQRMQRKEIANIEIVQTEMKGFGLRAGSNIQRDDFIYEYIGDVVNQASFAKRMREYAEEGIKHFYFMMLQKDEFLDATKRGGIGRFANHSCNPNCYVAKWTVGRHVRMGIYAKRNIQKDEELTFNYNVDRYGHEAQQCYCGELNCVGVLGGKTQTDVAAMDDLYLDALGISDEVAMYGLKGSKKKKSKKLDEDYCPESKPLIIKDVPKVVLALSNTKSRVVLVRLLDRLRLTNDAVTLRQLMRLRGCTLIRHILEENVTDNEICISVLESLRLWPFLSRNKIDDSQIEDTARKFESAENEHLRTLAKEILEAWAALQTSYRIPKRQIIEEDTNRASETKSNNSPATIKRFRPSDYLSELQGMLMTPAPSKPNSKRKLEVESSASASTSKSATSEQKTSMVTNSLTSKVFRVASYNSQGQLDVFEGTQEGYEKFQAERKALAEAKKNRRVKAYEQQSYKPLTPQLRVDPPMHTTKIIEIALKKAEEERRKAQALEAAIRDEEEKRKKALEEKMAARKRRQERRERKERQKQMTPEEKELMKLKRMQKLIGEVCVKQMNKECRHKVDKETFKKRAKEMTDILVSKEKQSSWFTEGKLDKLPDKKVEKMKQFAHDFIKKFLHRMKKDEREKYKQQKAAEVLATSWTDSSMPSSSKLDIVDSGPSETPEEHAPGRNDDDGDPGMSIEEALGLKDDDDDNADGDDDDDDDDMDMDDDDDEEEKSGDPSPASDAQRVSLEPTIAVVGQDVEDELDPTSYPTQASDAGIQRSPEAVSPRLDKGKQRESWADNDRPASTEQW